jgi:hypothetical protein
VVVVSVGRKDKMVGSGVRFDNNGNRVVVVVRCLVSLVLRMKKLVMWVKKIKVSSNKFFGLPSG